MGTSSIALLQERFRQLERTKEMREERELLRKLQRFNPTSYEPPIPSGLLLFQLLTTPQQQARQAPNYLSVWSGSQTQCQAPSSSLGCMEVPLLGLLPNVMGTTPSSTLHVSLDKFRDLDCSDDVDTSLHL